MKFALAHKATSYMMVTCALFTLLLSGELSPLITIASVLAFAGSWWWDEPRAQFDKLARVWTGISVIVFAYSVLAALTGGDVLIIGAQFLIYLCINKLFNRRTCKDYQQLYILGFLMVVAGTVLNTQFTFGIFFLGFVVSSTWALILFHLRREMEDNFLLKHTENRESERVQVARILGSKRIVGRSFFAGTSLVSITVFVGASLLFLMIPRIGFGLFFQKSRSSITMTGFSDGVQLGGHGVIKNDDTVVMRVQVDEDYEGADAPYIHWRGVAFDLYENGQWRRSRFAPITRRQYATAGDRSQRHYLLYQKQGVSQLELANSLTGTIRQEIFLEPTGYDVLFGASKPIAFEFENSLFTKRVRKARNDEIRYPMGAGTKYVVYSDLSKPDPVALRKLGGAGELPAGFDVYLDIPSSVPERVNELAVSIAEDAQNPYDKVKAIETWLKSNLRYTLEMESPPAGTDPVEFFLFDRKKGHCEYFSSAMAIMVRALGVPSRNVNGFLGGEWNEYNNYIAVRAGDAHSWVEVYFEGAGWVTFDPTPAANVDRLGRGGGGFLDRMRRLADTMRFKWFKWVIEYDIYRQLSLFKRVTGGLRRGAGSLVGGRSDAFKTWMRKNRRALALTIVAVVAVIALVVAFRRRRRRIEDALGPSGRRRGRRSAMTALYAGVLAKLAKRGHKRDSSVTPREHAAALVGHRVPGADDLAQLTELYYSVEYGARPEADALTAAKELRTRIEDAWRAATKS